MCHSNIPQFSWKWDVTNGRVLLKSHTNYTVHFVYKLAPSLMEFPVDYSGIPRFPQMEVG